jgi:hypothetical protein
LPASLFRWNRGWKFGISTEFQRRLLGKPLLLSMPVEARPTHSLSAALM